MRYVLSRRQFLKLTSVGAVGLVLPWALEGCGDGEDVPEFFMPDERATLEAVTARILPTDQEPGAREAAIVRYIENLLTAFDRDPPFIYAGGPFSGRLPFPDNETGAPSDDVPDNVFLELLPLSRVKEIGWRVRLFGSANVPGGDFNDAALGPTRGLRDVYRQGLQGLDATSQQLFTRNFVDLSAEDQEGVLDEADQEFVTRLKEHTVEGMYAAPEYGGNRELLGWRSIRFDGDSQPLGYSIFDQAKSSYNEIPERPLSTPNPDEDFRGFGDETLEFVEGIVTAVGGERFF